MTIAYVRAYLSASLASFPSSLFLLRPFPPSPPRTHILTFDISFLRFALLFVVFNLLGHVRVRSSLDDQLSSVHLKNFFLLYPIDHSHCSFFFSAFHDFIDHYHPPHFSCFTLFIDFFRVVIVCASSRVLPHVYLFFSFFFYPIFASTRLTM